MDFRSSRNSDGNWFNYVKIKSSIGSNLTQTKQWTDGIIDFKTGRDEAGYTSTTGTWWNGANFYYSGGYITAFSPNWWLAQRAIIYSYGSFNFQNFEIGTYSWGTTILSECRNWYWDCRITKNLIDGTFSCNPYYYRGNPTGWCGFVALWWRYRCLPTDSIVTATPPPNPVWWWGLTGSWGKPQLWWIVSDTAEDLFTCTIRDWFSAIGDLIGCPIKIAGGIWSKFVNFIRFLVNLSYWIGSFGSPKWTGDIFWFIPTAYAEDWWANLDAPMFHTFSWTDMNAIKPDYANTYTGKDITWINHAMFTAWDNVKNMERWGIKGILAFSQYFLIIVSAVSLFALVLIVIRD